MKHLKHFSLIIFLFSILFGFSFIEVQAQKGFKKASPAMVSVVKSHVKQSPRLEKNYKFIFPQAKVIDIYTLKKAYDLNPNDLSLKPGRYLDSTFFMIFPLQEDMGSAPRLRSDRASVAKVKRMVQTSGLFPSRNFAAFIIRENKLGNFEIQF